MTPISKLLKQRSALFRSALARTRDINEANLMVHGVMASALHSASEDERDLSSDLAGALDARFRRLDCVASAT